MRLSFRVSGSVQGVGYRWFVKETAEKHNVSGWVRNIPDGSVEGEAQGGVPELDGFLKEIKTGHPHAKIENTETQEMLDQESTEKDFHIKPTV
ncbi:MAG: acylphosphatase [Elusimicrobia bacterium CG_4_10_14_0_2_um_filter_56_8]|nr:MAG: hypothetical protein AUJ51_03475 [Elusimicrobia bacterium CG1_02_56_21]PJA16834.1 MAG: acylphosphatase [Elusimicrobia bacterium CG_4_10_14_0_2_um_filter_56_8]